MRRSCIDTLSSIRTPADRVQMVLYSTKPNRMASKTVAGYRQPYNTDFTFKTQTWNPLSPFHWAVIDDGTST